MEDVQKQNYTHLCPGMYGPDYYSTHWFYHEYTIISCIKFDFDVKHFMCEAYCRLCSWLLMWEAASIHLDVPSPNLSSSGPLVSGVNINTLIVSEMAQRCHWSAVMIHQLSREKEEVKSFVQTRCCCVEFSFQKKMRSGKCRKDLSSRCVRVCMRMRGYISNNDSYRCSDIRPHSTRGSLLSWRDLDMGVRLKQNKLLKNYNTGSSYKK